MNRAGSASDRWCPFRSAARTEGGASHLGWRGKTCLPVLDDSTGSPAFACATVSGLSPAVAPRELKSAAR